MRDEAFWEPLNALVFLYLTLRLLGRALESSIHFMQFYSCIRAHFHNLLDKLILFALRQASEIQVGPRHAVEKDLRAILIYSTRQLVIRYWSGFLVRLSFYLDKLIVLFCLFIVVFVAIQMIFIKFLGLQLNRRKRFLWRVRNLICLFWALDLLFTMLPLLLSRVAPENVDQAESAIGSTVAAKPSQLGIDGGVDGNCGHLGWLGLCLRRHYGSLLCDVFRCSNGHDLVVLDLSFDFVNLHF